MKSRHTIFAILGSVILGGIVAIIVIYISSTFIAQGVQKNSIDPNTYQAVFLDNNQTYFGHLKNINSDFFILSDVYYIQLQETPTKENAPAQVPTGRLIQLGAIEPHGPTNEMNISKEHILFWENLRPDSQIIKTIQSLKLLK